MNDTIDSRRIHFLNKKAIKKGDYVLYWMQQSQRATCNHALCYAIQLADKVELPVVVFFGLTSDYASANLRHYRFMVEGLIEVERELEKIGIKMITWLTAPVDGVARLSEKAAAVVTDFGYLKQQTKWRNEAIISVRCSFIAIESDVIVPVQAASVKEEYSAATFRPKLTALMNFYNILPPELKPVKNSLQLKINSTDLSDIDGILRELEIDRTVPPVDGVIGGTSTGIELLNNFIQNRLDDYHEKRNNPSLDFSSGLSPYIHFGQISPLFIASKVMDTNSSGRDVFLEELFIRRELSINFVFYNNDYDSLKSIPPWAAATLKKHQKDKREYIYSREDLEKGITHDLFWNSAQNELVETGRIHNYMRMYWGKKIIEWAESPEEAFENMIYLNNRYALDGEDPNSYAGIAWCFGKHDRPWKERNIFGTVRYMNDRGLIRKFDMSGYLNKFNRENIK